MRSSPTISNLAAALSAAQHEIKGAALNSELITPQMRTRYADLASVIEAIKEPLFNNGLSFVQVAHDLQDRPAIETVVLHSSGEWLSAGIVSVPVAKPRPRTDRDGNVVEQPSSTPQQFGAALSYCRRYSLQAAFGVAAEDPDGTHDEPVKEEPPKPREPSPLEQFLAAVNGSAPTPAALTALVAVCGKLPDDVRVAGWRFLCDKAGSFGFGYHRADNAFRPLNKEAAP